jgi:antitoxin ParD1/3/4
MISLMGTKNISLPPELEEFIDAKVASGSYAHASEVVRDGLRLMMRAEAEKLEWLKDAIAESQADPRSVPMDEAMKRIKSRGRALLAERSLHDG